MTAATMKNVSSLTADFVDGIGVSIFNSELSVFVFLMIWFFPGFFDMRMHFEKLGFFI